MVEIQIINVRRSICRRGRRELITGRQKPELGGYDVIVGGELFTDYSDHPSQTCHAKPKTQINKAPTLPALSRWWDAYRKQLGPKDFSPKSQDAVAFAQIKERGALLMIDRGDIRHGAIDRYAAISGFTAGRWLWSVWSAGAGPLTA